MTTLIAKLDADIEKTIERLRKTKFCVDPIAGEKYSRVVSVMSSAYKRHGNILHKAILEKLKDNPQFQVWEDPKFAVPPAADHLVDACIQNPTSIIKSHIDYPEQGHRTLQVDVLIYDSAKKEIRAYEIKRGFGNHDAGKKRSILRDTLCLQILLKSYAEKKGLVAETAASHVIFYYGKLSIPKPFGMIGSELNSHFGFDVFTEVEEVNLQFQSRLFELIEK